MMLAVMDVTVVDHRDDDDEIFTVGSLHLLYEYNYKDISESTMSTLLEILRNPLLRLEDVPLSVYKIKNIRKEAIAENQAALHLLVFYELLYSLDSLLHSLLTLDRCWVC